MGRRPRDDGEGGCDIEQLHLTVLGFVSLLLAGTGCNPPPTPKSLWQSSAVMLSHWLYVWDGRLRKWSRLGLSKGFSTKRVMFYTHFIHLEREKGQGKQRDPGLSFSFEMNCANLHTPPPPPASNLQTGMDGESISKMKSLLRASSGDGGRWDGNEGEAPDPVLSFPGDLYPQTQI